MILLLLLVLISLGLGVYLLTRERFKVRPIGARFPGVSYLTFKKSLPIEANDFNLEVTFQTLDQIGGVLYAEKYTAEPTADPTEGSNPPGHYYLCIEYQQLVFYAIQIDPATGKQVNVQRMVLENNLTRGETHKVTLQTNGSTLTYEERDMSYPLRSLLATGKDYYVGGPKISSSEYVIPPFKGCIYSLKGPNGYVNFPVDHDKIKVGPC